MSDSTTSISTDTSQTTAAGDGGTGGQSGTYTPPATQADLDRIIQDRLSRQAKNFADYDEIKGKAAKFDEAQEAAKTELQRERDAREAAEAERDNLRKAKDIADWKAEVSKTTGVPANALAGGTKEEIEAHAETLKPLIAAAQAEKDKKTHTVSTQGQTSASPVDPKREFLRGLKADD